jgi:hypothetical protein
MGPGLRRDDEARGAFAPDELRSIQFSNSAYTHSRHSGAMRSIEPGISRFRVWSCGPSRNDGVWDLGCAETEIFLQRGLDTPVNKLPDGQIA